jgi:hypothetical protein
VYPPNKARQALLLALAKAKARAKPRPEDRQPGTGMNENGPQVQTNYPPNAWPSDGDHG